MKFLPFFGNFCQILKFLANFFHFHVKFPNFCHFFKIFAIFFEIFAKFLPFLCKFYKKFRKNDYAKDFALRTMTYPQKF